MRRTTVLLAALTVAPSVRAAELSAGYSGVRTEGEFVHGGALAARWPWPGGAVRLGVEATAHSGVSAGESRRELALLGGFELAAWRGARVSPFASLKGGLAGTSRHVEVFGVQVAATGVCTGACGYEIGPAAEAGVGLDFRLAGRWVLRLPEADYRVRRAAGITDRGLRLAAGLVWR